MAMHQMFPNIYACLVVTFFPNSGLPDVIWCMFWLCYKQGQEDRRIVSDHPKDELNIINNLKQDKHDCTFIIGYKQGRANKIGL
ncbi:hypothetical protein JHK86_031466 [Glycine max]|nr:hypothetical protein JHK86_031466 [Glycine max]